MRAFQKEQVDQEKRERLKQLYLNARNRFNALMRKRREDSWDAFLSDELWTNPYRLATDKTRRHQGYYETIRKTVRMVK